MKRKVLYFLLATFLLVGVVPGAIAQEAASDTADTVDTTEQVEEPKSFFEKLFPFLFKNKNKNSSQSSNSSSSEGELGRFETLSQDELNYWFLRSVKLGRHDLMVELLEEGALINTRDVHGRTALIEAARTGQLEICRTLIEFGASVNADDRYDGTALDYASRAGYVDIVNLLLKNGAKQQ